MRKIFLIILNYKNWHDTIECLESLQSLDYSDYLMIVVDNGSFNGSVEKIKSWANGEIEIKSEYVRYNPDKKPVHIIEYERNEAENGGIPEKEFEINNIPSDRKLVIIKNNENLGYSAGNNVGIRYAIKKMAEAVLIINPDVRIEDSTTLQKMVDVMFSCDSVYIVGPNIIDEQGNRQSPLREPSFFEECLNPFLSAIKKKVTKKSIDYLLPIISEKPFEVEKVSGSCLLIRTCFLKKIGLLDDNVFLYCEEPILSSQVKNNNGIIKFIPNLSVRHLHSKPMKENLNIFFNSRIYYLKNYKKYNKFQLICISFIYKLLIFLNFRPNSKQRKLI